MTKLLICTYVHSNQLIPPMEEQRKRNVHEVMPSKSSKFGGIIKYGST